MLGPTLNPGKSLTFPDVPFRDKKKVTAKVIVTANTGSMNVHKDAEKRGDEIGLAAINGRTNQLVEMIF